MLYKGHGFFTEDINLIRPHLEDFGRADFRALAATIALVRVDDDIPVARPILKTIIGYHVVSFFPLTLSLSPSRDRVTIDKRLLPMQVWSRRSGDEALGRKPLIVQPQGSKSMKRIKFLISLVHDNI
jgi:hypothetical protein